MRFNTSILFILVSLLLLVANVSAQMVVTTGQTAQQLAEIIAGPGVVVSNASITGSPLAIGAFTTAANPTGLGISSGVGLSNGDVTEAAQPEINFASTDLGTPGSAYLDNLTGETSGDAIILEFDFVPNADYVQFKYVFCSEEHPNFSCSNYVDPFAITITGVSVPLAETNIALIPGTSTPIQITTINNQGCGNPAYYIDNVGNPLLVFGGITTVMTASRDVICGETYHLRFLQSDGGFDQSFDTSCFIEENSLTTGSIVVETATAAADSTAYEGCNDATVTLTLNGSVITQDFPVPIWISGSTAGWGIDYDPIPELNQTDSTIIIPAGQNSVSFTISPINDNVAEGIEYIEFVVVTSTCGLTDTFRIYINDLSPITTNTSNDTTICVGNAISWCVAEGGGGLFTYTWDNGLGVSQNITPAPTQTTVYHVSVTDNCGSAAVSDSVTVTVDDGPTPFAGNDVSVCIGGSVLLNASSSAPNSTFQWSPATDLSNTGIYNPLCTPQVDMEYIVTVTRSDGCSNDDTVLVTITPPPTADFNLPAVGCAGTPMLVNYTGNANAAAQFQWNFVGGTITNGSGIGPLAVLWAVPGIYDVDLTVAWNGCVSNNQTAQIEILGPPAVNAGSDISFCSGDFGPIGSAPIAGVNYTWTPINGVLDPSASLTTVQLVNPTHDVQVLNYVLKAEEQGCKNYDTVRVTVFPTPTAEFAIPDGKCFNVNSFNLLASGYFGPNASFAWNFGPVGFPTGSILRQPQGIIFNAPGPQNVTLIIEDNGCISEPFVGTIQVYEMPVANFSSDVLEGCEPLLVAFEDQSYNGNSTLYRTWTFGNGTSSSLRNPTSMFEAGTYTVRLNVVTAQGCEDSEVKSNYLQVYKKPTALFGLSSQHLDIIDPVVTVTNLADSIVSSEFTFHPFEDHVISMETTYEYPDTGMYSITQIVATQHGCLDTTYGTLEVDPHYTLYIPNAFTPNNNGVNEVWVPQGQSLMSFNMTIYNRWDQELFFSSSLDNGWDGKFHGKLVPQGIYIYKIETVDLLGEPHLYHGTFSMVR